MAGTLITSEVDFEARENTPDFCGYQILFTAQHMVGFRCPSFQSRTAQDQRL